MTRTSTSFLRLPLPTEIVTIVPPGTGGTGIVTTPPAGTGNVVSAGLPVLTVMVPSPDSTVTVMVPPWAAVGGAEIPPPDCEMGEVISTNAS
jgi:hypothetical protein